MSEEANEQPRRRLGAIWFWISQVASVVGLISILDDLKLWIAAIAWAMARIRDIMPSLADLLRAFGRGIDVVLDLFRGIFRPLVEFLLQWLPFPVPDWVKDGIVVAAFLGIGLLRNEIIYLLEFRRLSKAEDAELLEDLRLAGVACEAKDIPSIKHALFCRRLISDPGWSPPEVVRLETQQTWNSAVQQHGKKLKAFATGHTEPHGISEEMSQMFDREDRAKLLTWLLAGFTALLVVMDWIFIR